VILTTGDIVAAMLDGEATLKTFKQSDDHCPRGHWSRQA
jgi:SOS-response transcriptional repressor LexA